MFLFFPQIGQIPLQRVEHTEITGKCKINSCLNISFMSSLRCFLSIRYISFGSSIIAGLSIKNNLSANLIVISFEKLFKHFAHFEEIFPFTFVATTLSPSSMRMISAVPDTSDFRSKSSKSTSPLNEYLSLFPVCSFIKWEMSNVSVLVTT